MLGAGIVGRAAAEMELKYPSISAQPLRSQIYLALDHGESLVYIAPTKVNLNLTVTPSLTARGSVGSDGDTGIGLFYEKDY